MPGIQDIYSVNVSNRYAIGGEDDDASDDYDPLDTLKNLEDEKKRSAEEAKKKKQFIANKAKNQKKPVRFQENKDSNIPAKKEPNSNVTQKVAKPPRQQGDRSDGPMRGNNRRAPRERQNFGEGDENRRPPRRRNDRGENRGDSVSAKGEGADQGKVDQGFGRPGGNDHGPRRDRAERYRGSRGGFGNGRGQGRGFGGHRNDGRDDRGKREFDRRSGSDRSGVKATDKRDGAGPRNWGTPGNEIDDTKDVEPVGTWQEPAETEEQGTEKAEKTEEATNEETVPKIEEPTEMTLDEWKAKQEGQLKPSFNIRKAGEGEDQEKWKDLKVLRKINGKTGMKPETATDDQHKKQVKAQVNVNIQFGDVSRGFGGRGRGRGDRGRGRGRGSRFGGERNQRQQYIPDVQNELEFPTLG